MKNTKKARSILSALIAALLCATTVLALPVMGAEASVASEIEYDENGYQMDQIPDFLDYNNETVQMLIWEPGKEFIFPDPVDGDHIQNDIYLSNREIEVDLGIKFDVTFKASHMSSGDNGYELYETVMNGRGGYEVVCCYSLFSSMLASHGALCTLDATDFPKTDMPWYPADVAEWEVKDHLYSIANNTSIANLNSTWVAFVNTDMLSSKGIANIEETVLNGEWTFAKMKDISRQWTIDAQSNSNSIEDADNVYGLGFLHRTAMDAFYYAAGFRTIEHKQDSSAPSYTYFSTSGAQAVSDFCDVIVDIAKSPEVAIGPYQSNSLYGLQNANTAIFIAQIESSDVIPENAAYSILVMPKMDSNPETPYRSIQHIDCEAWCVPGSTSDRELAGVIIEAISSREYRSIAPKWFESKFGSCYSSLENAKQIFELIRQSSVADLGRMYMSSVGTPFNVLRNVLHAGGDAPSLEHDFAVDIGNYRQTHETKLAQLLAFFNVSSGGSPIHTHQFEYIVAREATHLLEGRAEYKCIFCNFITKSELLEKLPEHTWEIESVTTQPTHTEFGVKTHTCLCGETKTEDVAKLEAHEWDNGIVTTEPTVDAEGVKTYTCTCGETKTEAIAKLSDDSSKGDSSTEKSGCGAVLTGGASMLALITLAGVCLVAKKKKD